MARSLTVPWTARRPMSPPGKKIGRDDKGVGGEGEAGAADGEHSLIVEFVEHGIAKGGQKDFIDEVGGELAAAAMAEHDLRMLVDGDGAGAKQRRGDELRILIFLVDGVLRGCHGLRSSSIGRCCTGRLAWGQGDLMKLGLSRLAGLGAGRRRSRLRRRPLPKPWSRPRDAVDCRAWQRRGNRAAF